MKLNIRFACLVGLSTLAVAVSPTLSNANPVPEYQTDGVTVINNNIELNRAKKLSPSSSRSCEWGFRQLSR